MEFVGNRISKPSQRVQNNRMFGFLAADCRSEAEDPMGRLGAEKSGRNGTEAVTIGWFPSHAILARLADQAYCCYPGWVTGTDLRNRCMDDGG